MTMKKLHHTHLHDWAVPKNCSEPFHVTTYHISISEVEKFMKSLLKSLKPFNGRYQVTLEFTEPNTDERFVLGHVSAVIIILAEREEDVLPMRGQI